MKKLFVVALAAIGMVACVQNEVVEIAKSDAIAFADAFISNSTRAEVGEAIDPSFGEKENQEELTAFQVWAFMNENDGTVFNGDVVTKKGENLWGYDVLQYWMPGGNKYYFAGVAPVDGNWTAKNDDTSNLYPVDIIDFINVDGTEDLLFAEAQVETPATIENMEKVKMQFRHLLSKVKFTFKNTFGTENVRVNVTDIQMVVPAAASINMVSNVWGAPAAETLTLNFGGTEKIDALGDKHEAEKELLTIPTVDYDYEVKFTVEVYQGEQSAFTREMTSTLSGLVLEQGKAYNFTADINQDVLDLKPIEFTATVVDWVEAGDFVHPAHYVSTIEEFQAALNAVSGITRSTATPLNPAHIYLANDITGNVIIDQVEGASYIIDGCGNKFDGTMEIYGHARFTGAETLTIKNVNFESATAANFILCNTTESEKRYAHNITVENCTFAGNSEAVALRLRQCYDLLVKDCVATGIHSFAQITAQQNMKFENVTVEAGSGFNFLTATHGETVFEGCTIKATEADGYGIRVDAAADKVMTINNSTIEAYEPIVLRSAMASNTTYINNTTLVAGGENKIVVKGETPAIYIDEVAYAGQKMVEVTNDDELKAALNSTEAVYVELPANTYGTFPAVANGESVIVCAEGTVFEGNSKLNIKGATVVNATFSNPTGTAVDQTINGTFKGCTFTGSNGARWCYAGETVVFEDCVFDGSVYGVHFDGGANDVIFRNCTISGFNALGGALTMVTFEGCTFVGNGKSGYNGANLWGSAKLINCEFTFDGSTNNEWIDCIGTDKTYEFENCTVNGVAYTPANYTDYEDIFSRNNVVVKINGVDCQM